jgi:hypothetical protein
MAAGARRDAEEQPLVEEGRAAPWPCRVQQRRQPDVAAYTIATSCGARGLVRVAGTGPS